MGRQAGRQAAQSVTNRMREDGDERGEQTVDVIFVTVCTNDMRETWRRAEYVALTIEYFNGGSSPGIARTPTLFDPTRGQSFPSHTAKSGREK